MSSCYNLAIIVVKPVGYRPGLPFRCHPISTDRKLIRLKAHRLALLILAIHLVLGIAYSVTVPLWEAYDEWGHYPYIRYLATARTLPSKGGPIAPENDTIVSQPPLYYILGAVATSWIDTSDWREPLRNRYSGQPTAMGGRNQVLHGYDEDFPWHGVVLAAHVARFVSIALSAITVWFSYLVVRTLVPSSPEIALGGMAICAFWPQFVYMNGSINNDNLVNACAAVLLWFLVRSIVEPGRWQDRIGLVTSLGVAVMAKAIGLTFLPVVVLGLLASWSPKLHTLRRRQVLSLTVGIVVAIALSAVIFSIVHPQYVHQINGMLTTRLLGRWLSGDWSGGVSATWVTLWASFGVDHRVFSIIQPVLLGASLGLGWYFFRSAGSRVKLALASLLLAFLVVAMTLMYRALSNSYYFTGRYLLSTIAAFSTLLAVGVAGLGDLLGSLLQWAADLSSRRERSVVQSPSGDRDKLAEGPTRISRPAAALLALVSIGMLAFAVYAPLAYIAPVYARPEKLPASVLDTLQHPLHVDFDHALELAGYDLQPAVFHPGETVKVTLYWHCLQEVSANYSLAIRILGLSDAEVASLNTYPGRGNYPTFMWRKGDVFEDTYWLPIAGDAAAPTLARLKVAFFRAESGLPPLERLKVAFDPTILQHLPAYDPAGQSLGFAAIFGRFKVSPTHADQVAAGEAPQHVVDYRLGDVVRLIGYDAPERVRRGEPLSLTLHWEASGPTERPYTVFVHVTDTQGRIAAQADGQPVGGYYPTDLWSAKDSVVDAHSIALPADLGAGAYRVVVGLYDLDTGQRLAVSDTRGQPVPDDQIPLTTGFQVED